MKNRWVISLVFTVFLIVSVSIVFWLLKEADKPKVIAVVQRLDIEYWKSFKSGAQKAFEDFDIDGQVMAPSSLYPITNQPDLLKKVLHQSPDALITAPTHPSVAYPILMEYTKKNIPIILTTSGAEWKYQTAFIGTDNITLGKTAGMLLGSMLQPGDQVAIIHGRVDDGIMIDRKNSAKEVLEEIGIEIVVEQLGYDHFGNPIPVMESVLHHYPNLKGVVATTDRLALEALKTIEKKRLNIPVIGTDGLTEIVESVDSGKIDATLSQNPYDMGYLSVEQAYKAIKGEHIQQRIDSGVDIITADNSKERLSFLKKTVH
ncbi:sugar ABC transporter substrate-binding protein [Priestia abyssalis]|uniref:sugar ABC transporter substrate-binding protein n=1 Tax=Priestia abyssalis TaxID=1221450 RepID=UPI001475DCDE|nr:substrate-binding domain-containing protein [Priestia abyssalis]